MTGLCEKRYVLKSMSTERIAMNIYDMNIWIENCKKANMLFQTYLDTKDRCKIISKYSVPLHQWEYMGFNT